MLAIEELPWQQVDWRVLRGIQSREEVRTLLSDEPERYLVETLFLIAVEARQLSRTDPYVDVLLNITAIIDNILRVIIAENPSYRSYIYELLCEILKRLGYCAELIAIGESVLP